jgi:hypothetical protein
VWEVPAQKAIIVLQRSLCVKGAQKMFAEKLYNLITNELGCTSITVLTGASTEGVEPSSRYFLLQYSTTAASYS